MNSEPTSPRYIKIIFFIGMVWALFVLYRYLGVDNGFLFDRHHSPILNRLLQICVVSLLVFGFGAFFGYAAGQNRSKQAIIGIILLILILVVSLKFSSSIQSTWSAINNLIDGQRVALFIGLSAILGVGLSFGFRVSRYQPSTAVLTASLSLPFLFTALRANALASILAILWLFFIAEALGRIAVAWLDRLSVFKTPSKTLDRAGQLYLATGLAILIIGILLLGLAGGTSTSGILLALLLLTIVCFEQIKNTLTRFTQFPWHQRIKLSAFEFGGLMMLTALFLIYWIDTVAPEVGPDAIGFRTAAPVIWLRTGSIQPLPHILSSYGSFAAEMLHMLVLPLTGFPAAKVVQFGLAISLIVSAYFQVYEPEHRQETALLLFAFWGSTIVWWQMSWGFVDLSQTFFYFACILSMRFWLDEQENPLWLILAGILGATATAIKLNAIGSLVSAELIVIGVTLYHYRLYSIKKIIQNSLFLSIPASLTLLPWLLRSYLLSQNPIFPFLNDVFRSPLYPLKLGGVVGVDLSFLHVIRVPWDIFFNPAEFGSFATYHPLLLALSFLGLTGLLWVSTRKDWIWFITGAFGSLVWLVSEQNLRYSMYAVYLLTLSAALGWIKWQEKFSRLTSRLLQMSLLFGMLGGFAMQALRPSFWMGNSISGQAFPSKVIFGEQTSSEYLQSMLPTYFCAEWHNQHYGLDTQVFQVYLRDYLYFEAPSFTPVQTVLPIAQPLNEILQGPVNDNSSIYQLLRSNGYTHILYDTSMPWLKEIPESQRGGLFSPAFEAAYLKLECADRGLRLYKIRDLAVQETNYLLKHSALLKNSGFETIDSDGLPLNWSLSGKVKVVNSAGDNALRLENDALISQPTLITGGVLYELNADYMAISSDPDAFIQINWYDSSGMLRLFWRETITPEINKFNSYRFLQTAPSEALTAVIYASGDDIAIDNIIFSTISNEAQLP